MTDIAIDGDAVILGTEMPGDYMAFLTPEQVTLVAWPSCPDCGTKCARFIRALRCPEPTVLDARDDIGGSG
jgi:hypothetical protein